MRRSTVYILWSHLCMWFHSQYSQCYNHMRQCPLYDHNMHFHHMDLMNMGFPLKGKQRFNWRNINHHFHWEKCVLATYLYSQNHPRYSLVHNNMHRTLGHSHILSRYLCKHLPNIHQCLKREVVYHKSMSVRGFSSAEDQVWTEARSGRPPDCVMTDLCNPGGRLDCHWGWSIPPYRSRWGSHPCRRSRHAPHTSCRCRVPPLSWQHKSSTQSRTRSGIISRVGIHPDWIIQARFNRDLVYFEAFEWEKTISIHFCSYNSVPSFLDAKFKGSLGNWPFVILWSCTCNLRVNKCRIQGAVSRKILS